MSTQRQTLLVTGAAGFIGGRVAQRFRDAGHQVLALDLPGRDVAHLAGAGIVLREADITDPGSVSRALNGRRPDWVVHCAALMGGWGRPEDYRRVNVEGTRHVANWAAANGVARFIYVSSVSVYGMPPVEGITEQTPFRHIGLPYGDSKIEAEAMLLEHHRAGLPCTILRPGDVYGPRATEWVIKLVDSMKSGKMILIGGGRGLINTTHVDNLVDAIEAALTEPAAAGRDYIITDGSPATWRDYLTALAAAAGCAPPRFSLPIAAAWPAVLLLEAAGKVTGRRPPLSRMGLSLLTARCTYNVDRARRELGWGPRIGLAEGMRQISDWLKSGHY